jgi:hypothetical protein
METHIHVMTSLDATVNANETLSGGSITHVGQMFFDQDLIKEVDALEPYASNEQTLTENADDSILSEEAATTDPFVEYVLLGDTVAEGIFGWLAFGMDTTASYNITPAAYWTENGGVENENAGAGMGGGPPGGSGAPPSGAMPTGTMPASNLTASGAAISSTLMVVSSSAATSLAGETTSSVSGAHSSRPAASNRPQRGDGKGPQGQAPSQNGQGKQNQQQDSNAAQHQQKTGPRA